MEYIEYRSVVTLCNDCKHFERFYARSDIGFYPLQYGHCTAQNLPAWEEYELPRKSECELFAKKKKAQLSDQSLDKMLKVVDNMQEILICMSGYLKSIADDE